MAADVRQQVDRLLDTMQSDIFSFASPLSSSSSSSTPPPPTSSDSFIVKAIRNDFDKILDIWVNKDLSYNTLLNECVIVEADDDNNKENKASYSDCDKKNDTNDQKSGQQAIEDQHQDKVDTDGVESLPPPPPLSCDSPSPPASPNTSKRHMEESTLRATQLLHHILLICHPLGENLELTATTLVRSWLNSRDEQPPLDASPASSSSLATFEALINKVINPSYLVSYGTPYIDDLVEAVTLTLAPLAENVWREKQFWNQKMEWAFNIHLLVAKADLKSMDHFSSTTSPSSLSSSSSASLHSSRKNPEDNILLLNTESRLAAAVTSRPESLVPYYLFRGLDSNWSACSKMVTLTSSNTVSSSSGTASTSSSTTNSIIDAASLSSIIGQTYIAIVNYKPANDMELLVKLGDSVEILGMFENDWTRICARNTRTGMDGVVPFSCLRPMKRSNSLPVSLPVVKIGGGGGDSSGVVGGPSVPTSGSGISRLGARYAVKSQSVSSSAAPSNSPVATLAGTLSSLSPPPPASSEDSIAKLVSTVISSSRGSFEKSGNAAKMFMSAASSTISTKKVEEKQMASYSIKGSNAWSGMMNQEPLMAFIYQGVVESVTKKETTKSQDFMVKLHNVPWQKKYHF